MAITQDDINQAISAKSLLWHLRNRQGINHAFETSITDIPQRIKEPTRVKSKLAVGFDTVDTLKVSSSCLVKNLLQSTTPFGYYAIPFRTADSEKEVATDPSATGPDIVTYRWTVGQGYWNQWLKNSASGIVNRSYRALGKIKDFVADHLPDSYYALPADSNRKILVNYIGNKITNSADSLLEFINRPADERSFELAVLSDDSSAEITCEGSNILESTMRRDARSIYRGLRAATRYNRFKDWCATNIKNKLHRWGSQIYAARMAHKYGC